MPKKNFEWPGQQLYSPSDVKTQKNFLTNCRCIRSNMKFGTVLLGKHGHRVVTATNGKESLEALDQAVFDIVLMDI